MVLFPFLISTVNPTSMNTSSPPFQNSRRDYFLLGWILCYEPRVLYASRKAEIGEICLGPAMYTERSSAYDGAHRRECRRFRQCNLGEAGDHSPFEVCSRSVETLTMGKVLSYGERVNGVEDCVCSEGSGGLRRIVSRRSGIWTGS